MRHIIVEGENANLFTLNIYVSGEEEQNRSDDLDNGIEQRWSRRICMKTNETTGNRHIFRMMK